MNSPAERQPPPIDSQTNGMRILHVVRNLDTGGAQEVVRTLVENLAALGGEPVVCSLADGPLAAEIRGCGVPVEIIDSRRYDVFSIWRFLKESRRIRGDLLRVVEEHDIDVIQTHLLRNVDFLAASAAGRRRVAPDVYWTFHNEAFTLRREHLSSHRWLLRPKRWVYRLRSESEAAAWQGSSPFPTTCVTRSRARSDGSALRSR